MIAIHTQMEDDGEPILDVKLEVPPGLVADHFPALAQTLNRWWTRIVTCTESEAPGVLAKSLNLPENNKQVDHG